MLEILGRVATLIRRRPLFTGLSKVLQGCLVPPVGIEPTPDDYKSTARPSCYGGTGTASTHYRREITSDVHQVASVLARQ